MDTHKNRRILVVDDNRAIHEDFIKVLGGGPSYSELDDLESALFDDVETADGFELSSAYQGEEALAMVVAALASDRPFATAFVDMRMPPGWDGVRTIEELWRVDSDLQVVISTAYSDHSWEVLTKRFGLSDRLLFLKKPFDVVEVRQLACALTEKWNLAQQARLTLAELKSMLEAPTNTTYALAGANDGLWDWSFDEGTMFYSRRWKAMLGYRDDELSQNPEEWWTRVHVDDREVLQSAIESHRRGETAQLVAEYRVCTKDGAFRWMLCRGIALRDSVGRVCRMVGSQTDVSERRGGSPRVERSEA